MSGRPYLLELIRYIHLNPLRARQVSSLEDLTTHPWCGHVYLLGKREADWQITSEVLEHFGRKASAARQNYVDFVADGVSQGKRPDLTGGGLVRSAGGWKRLKQQARQGMHQKSDERILGDGDFVETVLAEAKEKLDCRAVYRQKEITFESLVKQLAIRFDLSPKEILSAGKQPQRVKARSLLCYWAVNMLGMTATSVSREIGMSQSAVSRAVERGGELARELNIDFTEGNA